MFIIKEEMLCTRQSSTCGAHEDYNDIVDDNIANGGCDIAHNRYAQPVAGFRCRKRERVLYLFLKERQDLVSVESYSTNVGPYIGEDKAEKAFKYR